MINIIHATIFFILGFVIQIPMMLLGLLVCLWPKIHFDAITKKPFTNNPGDWWAVHLPKFLWLWDNEEDGARGDHRGWYWCEYWAGHPQWSDHFKYWFWLAIRNPANNFKRYVLGCDVRNYEIETLYGQNFVRDDFNSTGFQLVKAGWRYHFYLVYRYGKSDKALVIELGNKVQVRHNNVEYEDELDYWKGFTFEINPYKDIS